MTDYELLEAVTTDLPDDGDPRMVRVVVTTDTQAEMSEPVLMRWLPPHPEVTYQVSAHPAFPGTAAGVRFSSHGEGWEHDWVARIKLDMSFKVSPGDKIEAVVDTLLVERNMVMVGYG